MKKRVLALLVCLILIIAVTTTLVACDKQTGGDNKPGGDTPKSYTVTFEGEGIEIPAKTVVDGQTVEQPTDPTRTGYDFDGWFDIGGGVFDFDSTISQDTKITAKWTANTYTVTLDVDGGDALENTTKSVTFGQAFELGTATKDLLSFGGWALEDGTVLTNEAGVSTGVWNIADNATLKAKWLTTDKFMKNGLQYTFLEDGTLSVSATFGADYGNKVEIPAQVGGKAVTVLGSMQYLDAPEVVVPASVKEVSASAFANNQFVQIVDLSAFSGTIGNRAFAKSSVKIVDLGSASAIGDFAFEDSLVTILVIPSSVKSLGDSAFKSDSIVEIAFVGDFPTLGNKVFGSGVRADDNELNIAASNEAWEKLIENTQAWKDNEDFVGAIVETTGLPRTADVVLYQYTDEQMADKLEKYGTFKNEDGSVLIYKGIVDNVVFYFPATNTVEKVELFADTHAYRYLEESNETFVFNYENKSILLLEVNENGETIYNGVLYNYTGESLTYIVPEGITEIAAGAGMFNNSMRFLVVGDGVEKVGDFAFAYGTLFGVRFGKDIKSIGAYAFFGQDYLVELVFTGDDAPTIGDAAFCYIVGGGYAPSIVVNEMTKLGVKPYIFTPYSTWSDGIEGYCAAFAKSLEGISDLLVKWGDIGDDEADYKTIAYAKYDDFKKLATSSGVSAGTENKTPYGTVIMSGTELNGAGYAVIKFDEESGYNGVGYAYYSTVNGYSTSTFYGTPKKMQIFYGVDEKTGYMQSFTIYGIFADSENFSLRGAEAGAFGEQDGSIFSFDGYGNFSYYDENGATVTGTYTVDGATITLLGGMSGTLAFDKDAKTITYNDDVMTSLGEEAGVYYDLGMGAKIELDGKAYRDTESGVYYSGKLTLEYNGNKVETGYTLDGMTFKFKLDGVEKSWTYSRTGETVLDGYYDSSYKEHMSFKKVVAGLHGTFENGNESVTIDGYYSMKYTVDGEVKNGRYMHFADTNNILFFVDDECFVAYLDDENNTFVLATAAEAGKWYTTSGATYALYLDGQGHSIYDNGGFDYGTYTYDENTMAFNINLKGSPIDKNGTLDTENGYGTMVFDYWGASYAALSRVQFKMFVGPYSTNNYVSASGYAYYLVDGKVESTSLSYSVYVLDGILVLSKYGEMPQLISYTGEFEVGLTFSHTVKINGNDVQVDFTVSKNGTTTYVSASANSLYADVMTFEKENDSNNPYTLYWLDEDKTYVGITNFSYGSVSDYVCGQVTWNEEHTAFTITVIDVWSSEIRTHVYTVSFNEAGEVTDITKNTTITPKE
ncbi:MAG: leucine-rich repeat protein [Clostridia bacterium]|nr:leucine-rich repeat protein [Clostridia bacterium]